MPNIRSWYNLLRCIIADVKELGNLIEMQGRAAVSSDITTLIVVRSALLVRRLKNREQEQAPAQYPAY